MSDAAILRESGRILREIARRAEVDLGDVEETNALLQRVTDLVEPVVARSGELSESRRELLQQGLLSTSIRMLEGVRALRQAMLELSTLLLAPELSDRAGE